MNLNSYSLCFLGLAVVSIINDLYLDKKINWPTCLLILLAPISASLGVQALEMLFIYSFLVLSFYQTSKYEDKLNKYFKFFLLCLLSMLLFYQHEFSISASHQAFVYCSLLFLLPYNFKRFSLRLNQSYTLTHLHLYFRISVVALLSTYPILGIELKVLVFSILCIYWLYSAFNRYHYSHEENLLSLFFFLFLSLNPSFSVIEALLLVAILYTGSIMKIAYFPHNRSLKRSYFHFSPMGMKTFCMAGFVFYSELQMEWKWFFLAILYFLSLTCFFLQGHYKKNVETDLLEERIFIYSILGSSFMLVMHYA